MRDVVWKFQLKPQDINELEMPEGAEILSVAEQHGEPHLWARVDPDNRRVRRRIRCATTGEGRATGKFIGTVFLEGGTHVEHVFDKGEVQAMANDMLEEAWGIIANANGGDWDKASSEWKGAAERWREKYFRMLPKSEELGGG